MMKRLDRLTLLAMAGAFCLGLAAGCSDDSVDHGDDHGDDPRPSGAILIAERFNTPDGRVMYMGAFSEMPTEDVDISQMTELGNGDAFGCAGDAFFFDSEALAIVKYAVENDLSLTRGPSLQVAQEGITGWTGAHVCVSETRAYIFEGAGGRVVEWNPSTMVIVDAFDIPQPDGVTDIDVQYFEPYLAGDLVYFPVEAINWDTLVTGRATVATFDLTDESLTYAYDDRCGTGLSGHIADDGTFYRYQGYQSFFVEYGPDTSLGDCVLRVNPGQKEFDATFVRELGPTNNMWAVGDHSAVIMRLDSEQPMPGEEDLWDWWELPIVPTLVDLQTGEETAYTGLSNVPPMNGRKLVLDGQAYFQLNTFDDEGRISETELMRLTPSGAELAFTLQGGDFLTLERLW